MESNGIQAKERLNEIKEIEAKDPTEKIAGFIVETRYNQIPEDAVAIAKRGILDCIGVSIGGRSMPEGKIIVDYVRELGGTAEAVVIGGGLRAPAPQAALANGIMATALDWADTSLTWNIGHPSQVILPAVLALGDKCQISGSQAIEAYITGFEVGSRIGSGLLHHYELGWHTTATVGTMAATAAAARILELNIYQTRMALGIAGSTVSGMKQNFSSMTISFHAGKAARDGIVAASLAQKGYTAHASILEGPMGLAQLMTGGKFDLEKMSQGLGSSFDITSPGGLSLKCHNSCYLTQWCIDAMLYLIKEHHIKADDVAEVICELPSVLAQTLTYSRPETGLDGMFSMEYCMAAALLDGEISPRVFTDDKVRRTEARELVTRVKCVPTEVGMPTDEALRLPQRVTVKVKNGKEYSHEVRFPRGDIRNPMTDEEINDKFRECASLTFTTKQIARVLDLTWNLESLPLLSNLTDLLF